MIRSSPCDEASLPTARDNAGRCASPCAVAEAYPVEQSRRKPQYTSEMRVNLMGNIRLRV
jgi:hypothetical protein